MTSSIDPTKPEEGNAYTVDVRSNFARAADEISSLQDRVDALEGALGLLTGSATWPWQTAPQVLAGPPKPTVGVDTDDPAQATLLTITAISGGGTDYSAWLGSMIAGDGIMIWQRTAAGNQIRYIVTGPPTPAGAYLQIPVELDMLSGVEPANGVDVNLNLLFSPRGGTR